MNQDEPDCNSAEETLKDEDYEIFICNNSVIASFCVKSLKNKEIEYAVSSQLYKDLENKLKQMQEDHEKLQTKLDKLSDERDKIIEKYEQLVLDGKSI